MPHSPSFIYRIRETFGALHQLVKDVRIKHVGVSNFNLKQLKEAQALSASPLLTSQAPYNLFFRALPQTAR
jgi:2,5-diketo-D-gluconate reductase B